VDDAHHLVLVGLMGAGKTTVGERCAARLGRAFVDTDQLVVAAAGASIDELFAIEGEAGFRARERDAVADAVASPEPLVVACGGGAVLDPANRRVLRERGFVVWLDAAPDALAARLAHDDSRPLLAQHAMVGGGDRSSTLTRLRALREPAYESAAHARVDTDGRSVDDVADAVIEELRAWNG
jgi:shikimate kinase